MDDLRKKNIRRDATLSLLALAALVIASVVFYRNYILRRQNTPEGPQNPSVAGVDVEDFTPGRFIDTLDEQKYLISMTSTPVLPLSDANVIARLLNSDVYTNNGSIYRIDFKDNKETVLINGDGVHVLYANSKTYTTYPNAGKYVELIDQLRGVNFNIDQLYQNNFRDMGFTETSDGVWESNKPTNVAIGNTSLPINMRLYANKDTGFIDNIDLFSKSLNYDQKLDIKYQLLTDEMITQLSTIPADHRKL